MIPPFASTQHSNETCCVCNRPNLSLYYHCTICPGDGYKFCSTCADEGISCPDQEHSLMKRVYDPKRGSFVNEGSYTRARGLRVFVNGELISGIGDTGSEETIISEERCREMGKEVTVDPKRITLGNGRKMFSMGTVKLPVAFPDSPDHVIPVIARVVRQFSFDILLGNPFLQATQTMQKYIHRFTRCLFSTTNLWSFYRIGETSQRFHASMGNNIPFAALADTGSRRNVMSADWAFKHGFQIRSETENLGWITFPAGPEEPTIGQVHTWISLPNGKLVPIVFDVLPTCRLPVVLGVDFVLDNNIYQQYAGLFSDLQMEDDGAEPLCMGMGRIPWFVKAGGSIKDIVGAVSKGITSVASSTNFDQSLHSTNNSNCNQGNDPQSDTTELKRQLAWDRTYDGAKKASVEEWNAEIQRRGVHEGILYPDNQPNLVISLSPHSSPDPNSDSGISTQISTSESNESVDTDTGGLTTVHDSPHHYSTDEASLAWSSEALESIEPVLTCTTPFGQLEAAQWQT